MTCFLLVFQELSEMNVPGIFIFFIIKTFVSVVLASTNMLDMWKLNDVKIQTQKINSAWVQFGSHWPNGIIPYLFDILSYDRVIARRVSLIMKEIESVSCIRFKTIFARPNLNVTWLHITNPLIERECMHEPRYNETGEVMLVLGLDCLTDQQILHTLMHGIGFKDEVTHPRRDQYVRILWNNIQPAYHNLFRIQMNDLSPRYTVEYDPMSVMHFHDRAYSVNGHATIAPLISGLLINPSNDLSMLDKMKLRLFFGHECKKRKADDLLDMCKMVLHRDIVEKSSSNNTDSEYNQNISGSTENESQNKEDKALNKSNNNINASSDSANQDNTDVNDDEKSYVKEEMQAHGASEISKTDY